MIHRIGTTIGAFLRIAIIIVCYVWVALAPKRNGAGDGQLIWYYISSRGESLISDKPIRIASSQEELTKTKCQQRGHDPSKSLQRPPPSALRRLRRTANALLPTTMQCTKICAQRNSCG